MMQRREFITLLVGGATVVWSPTARAQAPDRMRRVSLLLGIAEDDPEDQTRLAAFLQGLQENGWSVGRNLRIDTRWGAGDADRIRKLERIPVRFEHTPHGERNSCIPAG
jgi:putative tryptophan/tyrosine transport system substrate-binding protein